jgi:hypothetical protein
MYINSDDVKSDLLRINKIETENWNVLLLYVCIGSTSYG